jgi:hypothetical protein
LKTQAFSTLRNSIPHSQVVRSVRPSANKLRCVICDSCGGIELNHAGGRNHVAWFTMPFCQKHHTQFHALVRAAGISLEYTADPRERYLRAMKALGICNWMLLEAMHELDSAFQNSPKE